jgi:hypothetical protein
MFLKTNFRKFSISKSFKIFLKFEFFELFKSLKINHQNCSLSWPHIWKVSFWDLNAENLVHLTFNDPYALDCGPLGLARISG